MKMLRLYSIVPALLLISGCMFSDNDTTTNNDSGSYVLTVSDTTHVTYPGGGGIFLIQLHPDSLYTGTVMLALSGNPGLNATLYRSCLTKDATVSEILMKPDSTIIVGDYNLRLKHKHGGRDDCIVINIQLVERLYLPNITTDHISNDFDQWLADTHPEYGIHPSQIWYRFSNNPQLVPGLPSDWSYVNNDWHIRYILFPGPENRWHYMLRRRGKYTMEMAAEKNSDTPYFIKIPIEKFGVKD